MTAEFGQLSEVKRKEKVLYSRLTKGIAPNLIALLNENTDNKKRTKILNEIIENKGFELKHINTETKATTKVFITVRTTDPEYSDNMNGAKALNNIGYDVYMLPKVSGSKSFDYILAKGNKVYAAELKTIYGDNSLDNRLNTAGEQSDRVVLNMVGNATSRYVAGEIRSFYLKNPHVKEIIVLKGGKPIYVKYKYVRQQSFTKIFMDMWAR